MGVEHIASVGVSRAYLSFTLLVEKVNHDKKYASVNELSRDASSVMLPDRNR